ncbi:hypothetical protein VTI74DRAFT_3196 [Chaetomium olivicolor]
MALDKPTDERVVDSEKIWACLITRDSYLPGLLTLAYSLRRVNSKYPLVALYTDALSHETLRALAARGIPFQRVEHLYPSPPPKAVSNGQDSPTTNGHTTANAATTTEEEFYPHDPRFRDCFTKLAVFSLTGYSRVVLLDADMLVRRNMDELMDLPLDEDRRLFAAVHACLCNPLHFAHYPRSWTPENCAFTAQHADPDAAQTTTTTTPGGDASSSAGLGQLNGGLVVLRPDRALYAQLAGYLHSGRATPADLPFADQSLLGNLFAGRWVALPYVYNALKTMRWRGVHREIWRDDEVKNVHYILTPKPWEQKVGKRAGEEGHEDDDETDEWWKEVDGERRRWERENGVAQNGW